MTWLFEAFSFLGDGMGLLITGTLAATIVLFWDWRAALAALFAVHFGVAVHLVQSYALPVAWGTAHVVVTALGCAILGISWLQAGVSRSGRQPGSFLLRMLVLASTVFLWRQLSLSFSLPGMSQATTELLAWLSLCALLVLSLTDNPFFSAVGLLLWMASALVVVEVILPYPTLVAIVDGLALLLALTCGYLTVADRLPAATEEPTATDITFPVVIAVPTDKREAMAPPAAPPAAGRSWRPVPRSSGVKRTPLVGGPRG